VALLSAPQNSVRRNGVVFALSIGAIQVIASTLIRTAIVLTTTPLGLLLGRSGRFGTTNTTGHSMPFGARYGVLAGLCILAGWAFNPYWWHLVRFVDGLMR